MSRKSTRRNRTKQQPRRRVRMFGAGSTIDTTWNDKPADILGMIDHVRRLFSNQHGQPITAEALYAAGYR